jgi:hypothetical protein
MNVGHAVFERAAEGVAKRDPAIEAALSLKGYFLRRQAARELMEVPDALLDRARIGVLTIQGQKIRHDVPSRKRPGATGVFPIT